jgi:hypothetical protein
MSPTGYFRRRIAVSSQDGGAQAWLEDDFHHFRVAIACHDGVVGGIEAEAIRHPWSLCPAAGAQLQALVGTPLDPSLGTVLSRGDIRAHCTHMFDIACLAIASAARSIERRYFDMSVEDRVDDRSIATLVRDDGLRLEWRVAGTEIVAPPDLAGTSLKKDFVSRATAILPLEIAEAAILLRRALFVSNGRNRDLDQRATAAGSRNMGGCFVMRPGIAEHALRMRGQTRDFSTTPALLLAGQGPGRPR